MAARKKLELDQLKVGQTITAADHITVTRSPDRKGKKLFTVELKSPNAACSDTANDATAALKLIAWYVSLRGRARRGNAE